MANIATLTTPVSDRDYVRGQGGAPVTLVEYGDYQCVQGSQAYYVVRQVQEDLGNKVNFVFRNFPLTQIRPHALPAALAAEAAGNQDSFWEMHNILFEHQDSLDPEYLIAFAQVLGLDIERFIMDMTSDETAARVRDDFTSGIRSGVNGTPTFFINGNRHDGPNDYQTLKAAIEKSAKSRSAKKTKAKTRTKAKTKTATAHRR